MANPEPNAATRFQPGKSGNPGGKTSDHKRMEMEAAEIATRLRLAALSSMQDKLEAGLDAMELITGDAIRLFKDSEDRAHGTPKQAIQHGNDPDNPMPSGITLNFVAPDDAA